MIIRPATADDIPTLTRLLLIARRAAYTGILHPYDINALTETKAHRQWKSAFRGDPQIDVALDSENQIQAYIWTGPAADEDVNPESTAEIFSLHVHPDSWRQGYGTALCQHAFQSFVSNNYTKAVVWMLADHAQAAAFYHKQGFRPDSITKDFPIKRQTYPLCRYSIQLTTDNP